MKPESVTASYAESQNYSSGKNTGNQGLIINIAQKLYHKLCSLNTMLHAPVPFPRELKQPTHKHIMQIIYK